MRIVFSNVTKAYGSRKILNAASHAFEGPGATAIMGPSGAGKSTMLGLIAGVDLPESGEVHRSSADEVAWIVQSSPLLTRRSVWDNVGLGAECRGRAMRDVSDEIADALERLGISHLAEQRVGKLSGGERQRVAVARGMLSHSDVLLADEPTASLDAASRALVCDAIDSVVDLGRLVVVATHDEYVAKRCGTVVRLEGGRLHAVE